MAVKTLSGFRDDTYEVNQNNTTLKMAATADIVSAQFGIHVTAGAANARLEIDGEIVAGAYGVLAEGNNGRVDIGATGVIDAAYGVVLSGQNSAAVNRGEINSANGCGMYHTGPGQADLVNRGSIDAILGMVAATTDGRIVNAADGQIRATSVGITVSSAAGETFHVTNHGDILMSSNSAAILTSAGDDRVINDGRVEGYIYLGAGNDRFDTRGGIATSSIFGGADDDVLLTDRASYTLRENSGDGTADTVRSTVSYVLSDNVERLYLLGSKDINGTGTLLADTLHGNSGDNLLKGLSGADHLYGHQGDDRLIGGTELDHFHFSTGDDHDVILDYVDGDDKIDVSGWNAITSFADLLNHHAKNQGSDVLIEAGGDSLLIKGVHKAELDAVDFILL